LGGVPSNGGAREPTPGQHYLVFESTGFPTEGGWIGDDPDPERPPGREVIEWLSATVDANMPLAEIWNEEGYGWAFNCKIGGITSNVLVQHVDHWLVIVEEVSIRPRFLRGPEYAAAVIDVCMDTPRSAHCYITRVAWFTPQVRAQGR
jgi:hypothetical protein